MAAPLEECFALLAAVDRYPEWCPDVVRYVEVLERGAEAQPRRVRPMGSSERQPEHSTAKPFSPSPADRRARHMVAAVH